MGLGFAVEYELDFGEVPYPVPLTAKDPLGSLIYDPTKSGGISVGDVDSFTIDVDPGQTITVVVEALGPSSLQPTVELAKLGSEDGDDDDGDDDDDANPVATAAAAGEDVILQTVSVPGPLVGKGGRPTSYVISVSGANGTAGPYEVSVILNAAAEEEEHDDPRNDTLATAQDLESSFISFLGGDDEGDDDDVRADRGAVLGRTDKVPPTAEVEPNHPPVGPGAPPDLLAFAQDIGNEEFTISNDASITDATSIPHISITGTGDGTFDYYQFPVANAGDRAIFDIDFENFDTMLFLYDSNGNLITQNDDSITDPGSNSSLASFLEHTFPEPGLYVVGVGRFFSFDTGGQLDGTPPLPGDAYTLHVSLEGQPFTPATDDFYSFELDAHDSVTLTLTDHGSPTELQLFDPAGNLVAEDLGPEEVLVNGSFETGDFTGWNVLETGFPFLPWQVSGAGAGSPFGLAPTQPQDGSFVAWNGFDGGGPMEFLMWQDVSIPNDAPVATLQWQDRVQWNFELGGEETIGRDYFVELIDPATNAVLETLFSFNTGVQATDPTGDTGWQQHAADLAPYIGTTVRLQFREFIPNNFTGPGQIEFDAVSLDLGAEEEPRPTNVDRLIRNFVAYEPGTYTARVAGDGGEDYSLVVTRNAEFELEDNNSLDTAQAILSRPAAGRQWVHGHVGGTPGTLYGASPAGELITIDTDTGAGTFVGLLSIGATEIEHDNLTGRSFQQLPDGFFAGQEFDIETGAPIGGAIFNNAAYNGLEWVGDTLYGTAISFGGGGAPSELRTLDPWTGVSALVGPTGVGPVSGLAYDEASSVMYGIAGGGQASSALYTIDLSTGAATTVGPTGFTAGSLEFGADGALYGGGGQLDAGNLYRIDPATAEATLVGNTGFGTLSGLALRAAEAASDFFEVNLSRSKPLNVETFTPADSLGEFVNLLDPVLRLYDADGILVAEDDNSAKDGRNAKLKYQPSRGAEGTYLLEVDVADNAAGSSGGEYILSVKGNQLQASHLESDDVMIVLALDPHDDGEPWQLPGDADGSGMVDLFDFITLRKNFGKQDMNWADGDFDGDGRVAFADFLMLTNNFNREDEPNAEGAFVALEAVFGEADSEENWWHDLS